MEKAFIGEVSIGKTGGEDKLNIDMDMLSEIEHLLLRFRDVFRIFGMNGHNVHFAKEAVKAGKGAGIAALAEFEPEDDESGMRVSAAHVADEGYF